jgi:hypothetical protein
MSDQERERELARARAARWRAKHPGASAKAVAANRQRRKMKRGKADLAGVAAEIVKRGDIPLSNMDTRVAGHQARRPFTPSPSKGHSTNRRFRIRSDHVKRSGTHFVRRKNSFP